MSKSNENNRPSFGLNVGALATTREVGLLVCHKHMILKNVSVMDITAVAADGTDYVQAQVKKNGTLIGSVVDTQAGLLAREPLDLDLGTDAEKECAPGDVLSVQLTVAASGALTDASISADLQVKGS